MIVKDKKGNEIEISIGGAYEDDIQIEEAAYFDSDDEVSDETIDYILDTYADEIYTEWYENKAGEAESYYEGDR